MDEQDYQQYKDVYKDIGLVIPENVFSYITDVDGKTMTHFEKEWAKNAKANLKHHMKKGGWINDGFGDIARDKAVISIGAGPSYNRNVDTLYALSTTDGIKDFEYQDFITIASNHQVKPCFEKGIIPHFAIVGDSSANLKSQLDVGEVGKHTILIANLIADPDVVSAWPGPVKFITNKNEKILKVIEDHDGKPYDPQRCFVGGGNVLNLSFMIAVGLFRTSAWMCVGNDLSFPRSDDKDERRQGFYADGDYSTNIKSKRDEAKDDLSWMGFEFSDNIIQTPRPYVNFKIFNTSNQMFVYKAWLEASALLSWEKGSKYTIYNCSEQGILGMVLKEDAQDPDKYKEKFDHNNWLMMDEIAKNRWRTYKLEDAAKEFIGAKNYLYSRQQGVLMQ